MPSEGAVPVPLALLKVSFEDISRFKYLLSRALRLIVK
jgi:hypothetical protein